MKSFQTASEGMDATSLRNVLDHLYANLGYLDGKAGSLITLCGILIASYIFLLPATSELAKNAHRAVLTVGIAYAMVAACCCLRVIWVHWSSAHELEGSHNELVEKLLCVRNVRTVWYRRGWMYTWVSIGLLFFLFFDRVVYNFPKIPVLWMAGLVIAHNLFIYLWDSAILLVKPGSGVGEQVSSRQGH